MENRFVIKTSESNNGFLNIHNLWAVNTKIDEWQNCHFKIQLIVNQNVTKTICISIFLPMRVSQLCYLYDKRKGMYNAFIFFSIVIDRGFQSKSKILTNNDSGKVPIFWKLDSKYLQHFHTLCLYFCYLHISVIIALLFYLFTLLCLN